MAAIAFSWVNYDCTSVVDKDEEDIAIIKSHAMRMVHRQRRKVPHGVQSTNKPRLQPLQLDSRMHGDPLSYRPGTDWEEVAVCRFLENFVYPEQTTPVLAFQYLHFLPQLYSKNSTQSCLTEAVIAVAFACLVNQNRAPADLALRARKAYANALGLVRKSMSSSETRKDDRVLTSLCLLTKYEAVTGDADVQLGQAHEKGQAALVLERDDEWLKSDVGISLFRLVYIRHLLNCVAQSQRPSIHPDEQTLELAFPAPSLRRLMGLISDIANLRCDAKSQLCQRLPDLEESCRLAEDAVKATSGLTTLMKELPAEMMYFSIADMRPSCTAVGYAPKRNNIFQDLQHASFWHVFFYGFIQALQVLLHYSSFQLNFTPEDLRKCLLKTVDDICASVPFVLNEREYDKAFLTTKSGGAVAAHYLIWLLSAAAGVPGVPDAQREWLSDRLIHIGHVHGIKDALVPAII
ncbi:hypothetical protein LTR10_011044 [Elasticomyces elasticus]|nr:hypothetical protein LTR10_011044 [Elasticomyces elasticus]KAK4968647.1 hypothetical protein LTR42_009930 [Elasticomyces elasticus]